MHAYKYIVLWSLEETAVAFSYLLQDEIHITNEKQEGVQEKKLSLPMTLWRKASKQTTQLAFFINLQRAVIGPSATLTGRQRPAIDLCRMLIGYDGQHIRQTEKQSNQLRPLQRHDYDARQDHPYTSFRQQTNNTKSPQTLARPHKERAWQKKNNGEKL